MRTNNTPPVDGRIECGNYLPGEYKPEVSGMERTTENYQPLCSSTGCADTNTTIYYKLIQVTCPGCGHDSLIDAEYGRKFTEIPFQCSQCDYRATSLSALPNIHGWDDNPANVLKILGAYRDTAERRDLLEGKREPAAGGTDARGYLPSDYERAQVDYELGHRYNRWPWPD